MKSFFSAYSKKSQGFSLVELLVVMAIISVLSMFAVIGIARIRDNGRKVQCLALFKDLEVGLTMYEQEYQRPPIPESKRWDGEDTVYGVRGGEYKNSVIVAVLTGEDPVFRFEGSATAIARQMNPRENRYMEFTRVKDRRNGVAEDGVLYDPWRKPVMIAINGMTARNPEMPLVDFRNGKGDRRLYTDGYAEYYDTKPQDQSFVFWSYGADGLKGDGVRNSKSLASYGKSDDVISWE